jgi:Arc/MetJ family transcription regulator
MYNIELDEQLVEKAMTVSGKKTQRDTVHAALHSFIKEQNRKKILAYQGKGIWDDNLDRMRMIR